MHFCVHEYAMSIAPAGDIDFVSTERRHRVDNRERTMLARNCRKLLDWIANTG